MSFSLADIVRVVMRIECAPIVRPVILPLFIVWNDLIVIGAL